jgi:hypothetical protein
LGDLLITPDIIADFWLMEEVGEVDRSVKMLLSRQSIGSTNEHE